MSWLDGLQDNPIPWLLESENPSIHYWTLINLLDWTADDPQVCVVRELIPSHPPVAELLATQKQDGYWVKRDYYLPKNYGTFWVLSVLGDVGLTKANKQVQLGCEFMFTFQRAHGGFCRRRRIQGKGIVWANQPGPCTHARILRFLIQFGYADDPRTQAGINWLFENQRDDGMWHCRQTDRHGCFRATLDALRVAILDPRTASNPAIISAAAAVCDLLMEPGMGRYHVSDMWEVLEYPHFGYGVISSLEALTRLGYTLEQPKIVAAFEYLLSRQLPDGSWPLDRSASHPPFEVGEPGQPNKWLTLDALRVVKLLGGQDKFGRES